MCQGEMQKYFTLHIFNRRVVPLVFLFSTFLISCSKDNSPEKQIENFVNKGAYIAEQRDLVGIRDLVSKNYKDEKQRDHRAIVQIATAYIWRYKNIHIYTKIKNFHFPDSMKAELQLYVAMADLPILTAESLRDLKTRLYRFDLELDNEKGDWRISKASWWPATHEDFIEEELM